MPVIHGYNSNDIRKTIKSYFKNKIHQKNNIFGLGSIVPFLLPYTRPTAKYAIDVIIKTRNLIPRSIIVRKQSDIMREKKAEHEETGELREAHRKLKDAQTEINKLKNNLC